MTATVTVQTQPDGSRTLECWFCANNFSVDLHIPLGSPEAEPFRRVHDSEDGEP